MKKQTSECCQEMRVPGIHAASHPLDYGCWVLCLSHEKMRNSGHSPPHYDKNEGNGELPLPPGRPTQMGKQAWACAS